MKRLALLIGCLFFSCAPLSQTRAQERTLTEAAGINSSLAEPLKIMPFTLQTGKNHSGRSAPRNGGRAHHPLVQVENTSGKAIEYLVVEISFPGAHSLRGDPPFMLAYGQTSGQEPLPKLAKALQPGAKVELSVELNACEAVKSRLLASATQLSGSRVNTRINGVVFTDGTAWFDGVLHVADPHNPSRWNVIGEGSGRADSNNSLLFNTVKAGYSFAPILAPRRAPCWKRIGTQWVDCCGGLRAASAILVQVWGGLFEPFVMSFDCGDGTSCEYIKQVGCSSDPEGEVPPE